MTADRTKPGRTPGMQMATEHFGNTFKRLVELRMRSAVAAALAEIALVPHPWPEQVFKHLVRGIAKAVSLYLQANAVGTSLDSGNDPKPPSGLATMIFVTLVYEGLPISWAEGKSELATDNKANRANLDVPANQVAPWSRVDVGKMKLTIHLDKNIPKELSALLERDLYSQLVEAGLALGLENLRPRADWKTRPPSTIKEVLWDVRIRMSVFVALFLELYRKDFRFADPFLIFFLEPRRLGRASLQGLETHVRSGLLGYSYRIDEGQRQYLASTYDDVDQDDLNEEMALPFPDGICGAVFLHGTDSAPNLAAKVIGTYEGKNKAISAIERRILQDRILFELPVHVADIESLSPDGPELILAIAVPVKTSEPEGLKTDDSLAIPLDNNENKDGESNPDRIDRLLRSPYPSVFNPGEFQILREVSRRLINEFVRTPAVPLPDDVLLGQSNRMRSVVSDARVIAFSERPMLILGPAGSGKTQLAKHIWTIGPRNEKKFKITSGASFSQDLGRSELFGYMKGAHNQAVKDSPGILEDADGGTLFIDDFDVLPPDVQAMLLAVMEGGEFRRIGENSGKPRTTDVRFILATNADLNDLIAKGMRRDFLTRFAGCVTMPPLDKRREDIPDLVRHFVKTYLAKQPDTIRNLEIHVPQKVVDMLRDHDWSDGEVRALRYTVEMACTSLLFGVRPVSKQPKPKLILSQQEVDWALRVQPPRARYAPMGTYTPTVGPDEINANAAALGAGFDYPSFSQARSELYSVISNIRSFCEERINTVDHEIALTTSATAACEAGILALAPDAEVVLYTDLAHPNVVHAIKSTSRIISRLRGKEFPSAMVRLRDLVTSGIDAATLAARISEAILAVAEGRHAIVVLEHVAYEEGLRIPIEAICAAFEGSENQFLIDAAQAIGVWQPRNPLKAHVFGCFHKFIGAPAGTGFLALRDRADRLPYSIGYTIHPEQALDFPTTDIRKWELTSLAIDRLVERFGDPAKTEHEVTRFMERLRQDLRPLTSTLDDVTDPELRSHILTVQLASPEQAQRVVEELASHNVRVQEFGNRVRVSMGAQSRHADAHRIGSLLSHAAQSAKRHLE